MDTISGCYPGQKLECTNCGKAQWINWGVSEPDHLSSWSNPAHCSHHLCQHIYSGAATKQKQESLKATYEYCGAKDSKVERTPLAGAHKLYSKLVTPTMMKVYCLRCYQEAEFEYDGDWGKAMKHFTSIANEHKKFMPRNFCGE